MILIVEMRASGHCHEVCFWKKLKLNIALCQPESTSGSDEFNLGLLNEVFGRSLDNFEAIQMYIFIFIIGESSIYIYFILLYINQALMREKNKI